MSCSPTPPTPPPPQGRMVLNWWSIVWKLEMPALCWTHNCIPSHSREILDQDSLGWTQWCLYLCKRTVYGPVEMISPLLLQPTKKTILEDQGTLWSRWGVSPKLASLPSCKYKQQRIQLSALIFMTPKQLWGFCCGGGGSLLKAQQS